MQRLLKKFETAKGIVPAPVPRVAPEATDLGVIYYGSTSPAMIEAFEALDAQGVHLDGLRVRAFPFNDSVIEFIAAHRQVFVVEQNRDGQLRTLLMNEGGVDPAKLIAILNYDGSPITARFITGGILEAARQAPRQPE